MIDIASFAAAVAEDIVPAIRKIAQETGKAIAATKAFAELFPTKASRKSKGWRRHTRRAKSLQRGNTGSHHPTH